MKTEDNIGAIELGDTTSLEIMPNTLIEVEASTQSGSTLLLMGGEFTAQVNSLATGEKLRVDMSQAVAEITGTIFTVSEAKSRVYN